LLKQERGEADRLQAEIVRGFYGGQADAGSFHQPRALK
jgi:hypothetical protein